MHLMIFRLLFLKKKKNRRPGESFLEQLTTKKNWF